MNFKASSLESDPLDNDMSISIPEVAVVDASNRSLGSSVRDATNALASENP